jgi:hypothetical protein
MVIRAYIFSLLLILTLTLGVAASYSDDAATAPHGAIVSWCYSTIDALQCHTLLQYHTRQYHMLQCHVMSSCPPPLPRSSDIIALPATDVEAPK